MPTYGKIASLPKAMRNLVNEMLDENRPETEIAGKITGMLEKSAIPEIAEIEVTQQNVANWRTAGYVKWQAENKARELAERIAATRGDGKKVQDSGIADNIADCVLGELAVAATALVEGKMSALERRKTIDWIVPHITALRRGSHARSWIRIEALKLEMAVNKMAMQADENTEGVQPRRGISEDLLDDLNHAVGLMETDDDYEYKKLTPEDVAEIKQNAEQDWERLRL